MTCGLLINCALLLFPPPPRQGVAKTLMQLPPKDAEFKAGVWRRMWGFHNNYALGKHLTEQLVAGYQGGSTFSVHIGRPAFVAALAGKPYPG